MHLLCAFRPIWPAISISSSSFRLVDTYFWSYFSWLVESGCQNFKLAGNKFPSFPYFSSPACVCLGHFDKRLKCTHCCTIQFLFDTPNNQPLSSNLKKVKKIVKYHFWPKSKRMVNYQTSHCVLLNKFSYMFCYGVFFSFFFFSFLYLIFLAHFVLRLISLIHLCFVALRICSFIWSLDEDIFVFLNHEGDVIVCRLYTKIVKFDGLTKIYGVNWIDSVSRLSISQRHITNDSHYRSPCTTDYTDESL